jgi:prepilin-type N-terminal cleavage/methylation domain-containing protein
VRGSRGFTLIESLVALMILSLVITTSLAIFYDRHRRLRAAEETVFAWQAIANEAETLRHVEFATLRDAPAFTTSAALLEQLDGVTSTITVEESKPGTKLVRVRVEWRGNRKAEVTVVRTSTGGGPLW